MKYLKDINNEIIKMRSLYIRTFETPTQILYYLLKEISISQL